MSEDTGSEATQESTDTSAQDAVAAAVTTETTTEATTEQIGWNWSEGVKGEGDAPEWFKSAKYKSVDEQAKAYNELESKFGSFTGAPEEFTVNISEELKEKGVEIEADDPILEEGIKLAKEMGMNQEGFDKFTDLIGMMRVADNEAMQSGVADEMKALGNNAETRVNNLDLWGKANLPTDLYEGFVDMAQTTSAVKAMEQLVSMTRNAPVAPDATTATPGVSSEELKTMQFEKDEHGNRKLQTDPEFKARFDKLAQEVWGSNPHRIIVGAK